MDEIRESIKFAKKYFLDNSIDVDTIYRRKKRLVDI